jgi:hypothetical protein
MGDLSVTRARREGLLRVTGNSVLNRSMASWIGCSSLATVKPARKRSA